MTPLSWALRRQRLGDRLLACGHSSRSSGEASGRGGAIGESCLSHGARRLRGVRPRSNGPPLVRLARFQTLCQSRGSLLSCRTMRRSGGYSLASCDRRIRRVSAVTVLALALLAAFSAAEAQQPGNVRRIGYLSLPSDTGSARDYFVAFRDELRALGYVDGENIVIERRHADGERERLPELAGELIRLKVDVIVTFGSASAAKQATNTIPIMFIVEPDPVGTGLVASLAHPGGNITGISDSHADLVPKRLELLKEIVPRATRVGVLLNPANRNAPSQLKTAQAAGAALSLTVVPV